MFGGWKDARLRLKGPKNVEDIFTNALRWKERFETWNSFGSMNVNTISGCFETSLWQEESRNWLSTFAFKSQGCISEYRLLPVALSALNLIFVFSSFFAYVLNILLSFLKSKKFSFFLLYYNFAPFIFLICIYICYIFKYIISCIYLIR